MTRVVLADDQPLVRDGLRGILEAEPDIEVIGEAADGVEAVEAARTLRPDLLVMDVRMPRLDGIAATRQIVAAQPTVKILVLTTFDLDEYVLGAMRAGASGFLLKDAPREQLVSAVRMTAGGDALMAPAVTRRLVEHFVTQPPAGLKVDPALGRLSTREREVLTLLARGRSNLEIAGELFLSEATVKTHVRNILAKLDLRDRVHAAVFAYESGLVAPGRRAGGTTL
jgi:DNA-binding NarL/FixJ family response regulator